MVACTCSRGRDGIGKHRQGKPAPVAIPRRIGAVHDDRGAARRSQHIGGVHGVAQNPFDAGLRALRAACQRADVKAPRGQRARRGAADAASKADNQRDGLARRSSESLVCSSGSEWRPLFARQLLNGIAATCIAAIHFCMTTEPAWDYFRTFLSVLRNGSLSARGARTASHPAHDRPSDRCAGEIPRRQGAVHPLAEWSAADAYCARAAAPCGKHGRLGRRDACAPARAANAVQGHGAYHRQRT